MWLTRLLKQSRSDLEYNSQGTDDGGLSVGGHLYPGQGQIFTVTPENKRRLDVYKKKRSKIYNRRGEQNSAQMP